MARRSAVTRLLDREERIALAEIRAALQADRTPVTLTHPALVACVAYGNRLARLEAGHPVPLVGLDPMWDAADDGLDWAFADWAPAPDENMPGGWVPEVPA